jgi:septum formation protein
MIWSKPKIILASGSPRRKQIMQLANIPCQIVVSNADETISGEPGFQVRELALRKARAVKTSGALPPNPHELLEKSSTKPLAEGQVPPIILAADTLVYVDGEVLGKPGDAGEAFDMLRSLSGRPHIVYTGVALIRGEEERAFTEAATVFFRNLSDDEIRAYIATGEPFDKAGAYGVQERGAVLVDRIEGDFYTAVGLPISKVVCALADMGYDIW